ncbi:DUF1566 domain-containing protein [Thiothrix nivea]|uniref:Lcl C-terminal domain-containing protein n=1 Tax=Thiothrix nivea (strain ATCC 35100 / DSM 5205 / JP2) TaxID=870187 RepID=A0A656HD50_THINJ|nr:DUF1566 domain-containing protein [Thiothrix nivea]EIJ33099.1 protein of unknown function DUF1566 [Thiothrix nivea DSM 5205]
MNKQLFLVTATLLPLVCAIPAALAEMKYQGIGGWRTSDGAGGWVQRDDAENRFDIGIDACKQACEERLYEDCRGIEYVSNPNGWEEEGRWVHNKCEIHRDPYAHCDQSGGGRGSADDGCWIRQAPDLVGGGGGQPPGNPSGSTGDPGVIALDGCVRDERTGLLWQLKNDDQTSPHWKDKSYLWGAVPGYVNMVNAEGLCGRHDWRLPTLSELESIVDYGRRDPAIDTGRFGPTASVFHWSSSPVWTSSTTVRDGLNYLENFNRDFIAGVGFMDGYSGATPKSSQSRKAVRLVSEGR